MKAKMKGNGDGQVTPEEVAQRRDKAVRRALNTPQSSKDMKKGRAENGRKTILPLLRSRKLSQHSLLY